MRYLVILRRTETGYSADVPDLPGCVAVDSTAERTRKSIAKALEMHVELMHQSGERIPKSTARLQAALEDMTEEDFCTWVEVQLPKSRPGAWLTKRSKVRAPAGTGRRQ